MARHTRHGYGGFSTAPTTAVNAFKNKLDAIWLRLKSLRHKKKSLPVEVELCLLICSLFPDGSRIPIDDLVMYLMGLKLFEDVEDMFAARCKVNDLISIINDLIDPRNLFSVKNRLTHEKDEPLYQSVKLLIGAHDLAKSMPLSCPLLFSLQTIHEKWPELNSYKDFYGLSLVLRKIKDHSVYLECPKLAMLQLQYREDSQVIPTDFLKGMKELCILSLDIPSLPQSLNVPRNLRTLRIKVIKVEDMSWIRGLTNLEFLSISTSSLTNIPTEMGHLEKLRLLDLRKVNLAYFPPGVLSRLLRLEELYLPLSFARWGCKIKQHDDNDKWESGEEDGEEGNSTITNEIDDAEKINASLAEIVSPSLNALHLSITKASVLPKNSPIFKNIQQFKVRVPNIKYQPVDKDSLNELHLTGDAGDIKESGICDLMSRTEDMSLMRVENLKSVMYFLENMDLPFSLSKKMDLPFLKKMIISECEELEYVVDATQMHIPQVDNYSFSMVESLHLSMLSNLKEICNGKWQTFQWFSNLTRLSIRFCHKLKYVFPLTLLSRRILLKDIEILDCNEMKGVFYEDEEGNVPLMLGCIENLDLHSLPKLIGFSIPKDSTVDNVLVEANQSMTTNEIMSSCKERRPIISFHSSFKYVALNESISTLKEGRIDDDVELPFPLLTRGAKAQSSDTQLLSSEQGPLNKNKDGVIIPLELHYVFSSKLALMLRNLKRIKIAFCHSIAIIFLFDKNYATSKAFISLKKLELFGLRNLVHIWYQVPQKTSSFQNLQLLAISECNNTYLFTPQVAKLLAQLQKVYISRCEKMEEIIVEGDQKLANNEILFPGLEHLELQYMPNLKSFSGGIFKVGFPLLDSLKINQCNRMKSFSSGVSWTLKLERIEINGSLYSLIGDFHATIRKCLWTFLDLYRFTFAEMRKATKNFRKLLGKDGFGNIYEGWLHENTYSPSESGVGMVVAIKKMSPDTWQRFEEWQAEVNLLSRLSHPNLIKLVGYCSEKKELLLVYEFMQRGSLAYNLFTSNLGNESLSWKLRLKIAIGAAQGLAFLHTSERKMYYRDFKSSNILLDGNYNAKLSEFGVPKLGPSNGDSGVTVRFVENFGYAALGYLATDGDSHARTRVMGTYGYAAPEYLSTGHWYVKSDVYSFGVVLLELMTGLRAIDKNRPSGQHNLVEWLKPILSNKRKLKTVMDARIEGQCPSKAMMLAAQLCLECIYAYEKMRPSMQEVVEALQQIHAISEKSKGRKTFSSSNSTRSRGSQ